MQRSSNTNALSHSEVLSAIRAEGDVTTFFVQGQPGIGKSDLLRQIDTSADAVAIMVDCPNFEPGDLMVPVISENKTTVKFALNELLGMHTGKRIIMCLDEFAKSNPSVQASLLPLAYERRLGSTYLPRSSIVYATSNEDDDAVGDAMHAHAWNRMCCVTLAAPTHEEWAQWATANKVSAELVAFANAYPMLFEHYASPGASNNPYIFNPKTGNTRTYVSPRSLARCTPTINALRSKEVSLKTAHAVLAGKIGEAAALELRSYIEVGVNIPDAATILNSPDEARATMRSLSGSACFVLAANIAQAAEKDTATRLVMFLHSLNEEALSLALLLMMKANSRAATGLAMDMNKIPELKAAVQDLMALRSLM